MICLEPQHYSAPAYQLVPCAPLHSLMFNKLEDILVGVHVHWNVYLVTTLASQPEHSYKKTLWDNGIQIKFMKARVVLDVVWLIQSKALKD